MKVLKDILYKVPLLSTAGDMNAEINGIAFDSRKASDGYLFVAVEGTQVDGHDFIQKAIDAGAAAIVVERDVDTLPTNMIIIKVKSSSEALGIIASNYFDNPSAKLKLVGVTGTNGKTTVATLLYDLFTQLGYTSGLLSTIENKIGNKVIASTHTTGDAIQINELLSKMVKAGCTHAFMEVSSHAIDQNRIVGLQFEGGIFTNITHDHLDYHQTFDNYIAAKKKFFDLLNTPSFALVNADDKRGSVMVQNTKARKYTYSLKTMASYKGKVLSETFQGIELEINGHALWIHLVGDFNAYNVLAAYAVADLLGENNEEVLTQLSALKPVSGRFELVYNTNKITAIVDYAHTPDALKNVLETITELRTRSETLITVVGCGGNRDKEKRPAMGQIAAKYSDKVIFTSDNPRDEDPSQIIAEMKNGVSPTNLKKVLSVVDRKEAIRVAASLASKDDIILVAGKGHETYQEIGGVRHDFDDRVCLAETLGEMQ